MSNSTESILALTNETSQQNYSPATLSGISVHLYVYAVL